MNKHFQKAEDKIRSAISSLQYLLPRDGEDISYYSHMFVDEALKNIIEAKGLMYVGATQEAGDE